MRKIAAAVFIVLLGCVAGCGRPPDLAHGPIDLTDRPTTVRFVHPVSWSGESWELCFEFDLPGDSHHAATIHATLVSSSGSRAEMSTPRLDRRGESTVCQFGQLAGAKPEATAVAYDAVELSSKVPLRLRGIRGGVVRASR
jgi:hypothetical protein